MEGILHLRYIPTLDYVQVNVSNDGRLQPVDPASVEVVQQAVVPVEELEKNDPVVGHARWRRVDDLAEAIRDGLVLPVERDGLTWQDLFGRLELVAQPLLDTGWRFTDQDHEESSQGDVVFGMLQRPGRFLIIEHYANGWTVFFPEDDRDPDDEDDEDVQDVEDVEPIEFPPELSVDQLAEEYRGLGWL